MSSSLALNSDATIRFGDAVCTDGDFDISEEKYRSILKTSAPIGLRALRDHRLIALRQSSSIAASSSTVGGGSSGQSGSKTSVDHWVPATSDEIPVSTSILRFTNGPSKGNFNKRPVSRVPSKNRDELERIAKLLNGGDDDDEDDLDDDASLLRNAMVDAKKKRRAQKEAADTAAVLSKAGNTIAQYHYQTHQVTEREKEYIEMVNDSMTTILGMTTVRLFGVVTNVDRTHATVEVWRKGGTIFTEKRPIEKLPLTHLQKLTKREFSLVCNKPLVSYTDGRTRKAATGAVTLEDMPATLMSHTNEIVESLIQKMETTAKIQKQAVADEMATMEEHKNAQKLKNKFLGGVSSSASPNMTNQASPSSTTPGTPASNYFSTTGTASPAASVSRIGSFAHHQNNTTRKQQQLHQNQGSPSTMSIRRGLTPNPQSSASLLTNNSSSLYYSGKEITDGERDQFGKFKLAFSKDRHKLFRGPSLKNRQDVQSRATLPQDSPLLDRYFNSSGSVPCGTSVVRSLPEPPVTRLIDPLVDVRDELKALSVMNTSSTANWTPQSKYIQSIHHTSNQQSQHSNASSSKSKDAPGIHDTSFNSFTSLLPVLGGGQHQQQQGNSSSALTCPPGNNTNNNSNSNNKTAASMTASKLLPLQPSFVETSLTMTSPPKSNAEKYKVAKLKQQQKRSSSSASLASKSGSSKSQRIPQPVPPALLYSSYSADADLLPPEISCSVIEYRQHSKTLLLSIRRSTFSITTSTAGSGSPSRSNSPSITGRKSSTLHNNNNPASGRSANSSSKQSAAADSATTEAVHAKWNQALSGLSTILVKCAFVDILGYQEMNPNSIDNNEDENFNDDNNTATSRSDSSPNNTISQHHHQNRPSSSTSTSKQIRDNNRDNKLFSLGSGSFGSLSEGLKSPTNMSFTGGTFTAVGGGSSSASHGNRGGTGEIIVNSGDTFLQNLVGKTVDVIPLWSEWVDGQSAVIADVLRGDLSILDEMISSKFATVSSAAANEYESLRATFGQQQIESPGSFRGSIAAGNNSSKKKSNANNLVRSASGSGGGSKDSNSMIDAAMSASFGPMLLEEDESQNQDGQRSNNRKQVDFDAASGGGSDSLVPSATAVMQRMKSGYFSASTAHSLLENDPDLVINAAEGFLGRRVYRLIEAMRSTSNLKMDILQRNNNNNNSRRGSVQHDGSSVSSAIRAIPMKPMTTNDDEREDDDGDEEEPPSLQNEGTRGHFNVDDSPVDGNNHHGHNCNNNNSNLQAPPIMHFLSVSQNSADLNATRNSASPSYGTSDETPRGVSVTTTQAGGMGPASLSQTRQDLNLDEEASP